MRAHHGLLSQPAALLITLDTAIAWLTDIAYPTVAQQLSSLKTQSEQVATAAQRQEQRSQQPQQSITRAPRLPPIPSPPPARQPSEQPQPLVCSQPTPQLQPGRVAAVRRVSSAPLTCLLPAGLPAFKQLCHCKHEVFPAAMPCSGISLQVLMRASWASASLPMLMTLLPCNKHTNVTHINMPSTPTAPCPLSPQHLSASGEYDLREIAMHGAAPTQAAFTGPFMS